MDRRQLISSTILAGFGAGLALASRPALAFATLDCTSHPTVSGCAELTRHKTLLADIDRDLARRGVPEAQRKALEARAICPVCGALLIG